MSAAYIATSLGALFSNYLYQMFRVDPDWSAANERTFFQAVALILVGISLLIREIKA